MTTVSEAIKKRHSARAFKDRDVDLDTVKSIIQIAKQSPSGVNTNPGMSMFYLAMQETN